MENSLMARRTPSISTGYDQRYDCHHCGIEDLDEERDLDVRSWLCNQCDSPVVIELADEDGNQATVMRRQAQDIKTGHLIYLEHDLERGALEIFDSKRAMKPGMWYLAVQSHRGLTVEPDRYFNCVIMGDMV